MFSVWIKDGNTPEPEKAPYYILAKNGFFLHKTTPFWKATVPVKTISTLEIAEPKLELTIPPLPENIIVPIITFFGWVQLVHNTEALILLYKKEESDEYRWEIPVQNLRLGGLNYQIPDRKKGEVLIGTMHSHGTASAYHSSTDHHDEFSMDGIHITFGGFFPKTKKCSISMEAAINGHRFNLKPEEWLMGIKKATSPENNFTPPAKKIDNRIDSIIPRRSFWEDLYVKPFSKNYLLLNEGELVPDGYELPIEWQKRLIVEKRFTFPNKKPSWLYGHNANLENLEEKK